MAESLQYFRSGESPLRRDAAYLQGLRTGLGMLLITTFLSGACIASCFLIAVEFPIGIAMVSLPLLAIAVMTGVALSRPPTVTGPILPPRKTRMLMLWDIIAAAGLVTLSIGSAVLQILLMREDRSDTTTHMGFAAAAIAFFCFTVAVPRFHTFYCLFLAPVMRGIGAHKTAQHAVVLGWLKLLSDGAPVLCMFSASTVYFIEDDLALYPAFGALLALALYGAVWIYTWVVHIAAFREARRARDEAQAAGEIAEAVAVT